MFACSSKFYGRWVKFLCSFCLQDEAFCTRGLIPFWKLRQEPALIHECETPHFKLAQINEKQAGKDIISITSGMPESHRHVSWNEMWHSRTFGEYVNASAMVIFRRACGFYSLSGWLSVFSANIIVIGTSGPNLLTFCTRRMFFPFVHPTSSADLFSEKREFGLSLVLREATDSRRRRYGLGFDRKG